MNAPSPTDAATIELRPGDRLLGGGRDAYVVAELLDATAARRTFAARKAFLNYRFHDREFYEATDDEWIEVRLRTLGEASSGANAQDVAGLRRELDVVVRHAPWFGEPVDWISEPRRLPATESATASPAIPFAAPILIVSVPRGRTLADWHERTPPGAPQRLQTACELLEPFESLHAHGETLGETTPDEWSIDDAGRLQCVASDRVRPIGEAARDVCGDLFAWGQLASLLLGPHVAETVAAALKADSRLLHFFEAEDETTIVEPERLPAALARGVAACLSPDPARRPSSIGELRRQVVAAATRPSLLGRLREFVAGRRTSSPS